MPIIVKVLSFMLFMILVFTGIANLLPQVEGQAPKDIKVDLGALTMESYIAMGESIFKGKGTCTLCHNNMGRAPDIPVMDMEATALERLKDPQYKGTAKDSESYFRESMIEPSKFIVAGFGKQGETSTMPIIDKAPIELTEVEMGAVIAYLQAKDGGQPTVELPTDAPAVAEKSAASAEPPKPAETAEAVLTKNGCTACHAVLDSPATIGPELKTIGSRLSKEEIRESIINPSAVIAEGFPPIMPPDFANKMIVKELEMVVDFLYQSKAVDSKNSETKEPEKEVSNENDTPKHTETVPEPETDTESNTEQKGE
ncbi:MAG: c-type cytochrome [gamma proteobacterium symbiont of Taylorina sp.]|nr:c-type cytochrome [gamma proteobacterium symbiont of Taylorina sp.]